MSKKSDAPSATVGIAGAGLFGRVLALRLARAGWRATLFDRDGRGGEASCGYAGAGMLAPFAELDTAEPAVAELGRLSLPLWRAMAGSLAKPVYFQAAGSAVVAHPRDQRDLAAFERRVAAKLTDRHSMRRLDAKALAELEPELADRFQGGLFFAEEGQIEPRTLLPALAATLTDLGVDWRERTQVERVEPGEIAAGGERFRFDWAVDARGLGAKPDMPALRGVRGELMRLYAPEVRVNRPVRLAHPRYPLYVAPRPDGVYLVGATSIESEDMSPLTVKSSLELLSAAYSLHPGFAEANVLESVVHCRPALPDNTPRLFIADGLLRVNGLYRHGYLVSPALAEEAAALMAGGAARFPQLIEDLNHVEPDR